MWLPTLAFTAADASAAAAAVATLPSGLMGILATAMLTLSWICSSVSFSSSGFFSSVSSLVSDSVLLCLSTNHKYSVRLILKIKHLLSKAEIHDTEYICSNLCLFFLIFFLWFLLLFLLFIFLGICFHGFLFLKKCVFLHKKLANVFNKITNCITFPDLVCQSPYLFFLVLLLLFLRLLFFFLFLLFFYCLFFEIKKGQ